MSSVTQAAAAVIDGQHAALKINRKEGNGW
jgi:hypothetical protein